MILPIYSTSKLVRITLAGIVVFLIFAVSLLPAVLVLPTSKYEEISSFRPLVISNSTENRFSSAYSGGAGSSLSRRRALNLAWQRTGDANESDAWKRTESDFSSTASTTTTDLATDSMENGGSDNRGDNSHAARSLLGLHNFSTSSARASSRPVTETQPRKHRVTHPLSRGFILANDYQQQLFGGFKGFYHLSKIASALNLSVVEPFVTRTSLIGVPNLSEPGEPALKLSHFYDLYGLREAFHQCSDIKLETFEAFFKKSSHNIVFVEFLTSLDAYHSLFPKDTNKKILEIKSATRSVSTSLAQFNTWAAHLYQKKCKKRSRCTSMRFSFRKSRVFLIDARPLHPLSWEQVKNTLESVINKEVEKYGSATIVVPSWRDIQPPDMISSFFYSMPDFSWDYCRNMVLIPHSKTVMAIAEKFIKRTMKPHPVIGVHIRAERLLIDYKGDVTHLIDCLKILKNILRNGTVPNVHKENVHVFHDLGTYGSQSCDNYCRMRNDRAVWEIGKLGHKIVYFKPQDRSYASLKNTLAAFVDREYLTRVDVLVTVGRGEYQQNIVERFLDRSGGKQDNLHRICNNEPPIPDCYPDC